MLKKLAALIVILAVFAVVACTDNDLPPAENGNDSGQTPHPDPEPNPEEFDFAKYQPNELGEIPIWMYHVIGEPEAVWTRTPDNFRADLQRFYDLGYRLVSLTDVITNNIDIPAGTSPMVLTFDDGHPSHFRLYKDQQGNVFVDPDCAVGIILEFAERHPDMGTAATFFVNFPNPFSQTDAWYTAQHRQWKLEKLVEWGMEIGNHTWSHPHLTRDIASADQLQMELGRPHQWLQGVLPGYRLNALALPFGSWPKDEWRDYVYSGRHDDTQYSHDVILLVGSQPARPYNHVDYTPWAMPRVRGSNFSDGGSSAFLDRALERLENTRYISDGNPDIITIPEAMLPYLNQDSLGDKELRVYNLDEDQ